MTGFVQSLITIVLFIVILGVLVVIHELGHFVTARLANVRVLEFGIGFPPRAKVLRSKGETLYTLNWLPIGGFVKLEGEDGDQADDPRSFASQGLFTKLWILVAGVLMNLLLAFVIFTGIALFGDPTIGERVVAVEPGSPAEAAGFVPGDVIVSVDGKHYGAFSGGSLAARPSGPTRRDRHARHRACRRDRSDGRGHAARRGRRSTAGKGALGFTREPTTTRTAIHYGVVEAIQVGAERTIAALGLIVGGLGTLVESVANDPTAPPPVSGPGRHRDPDRRHLLATAARSSRSTSRASCRPTSRS